MRRIVRLGALALVLALLAGVCAAASAEITKATVSGKHASVRGTVADLVDGDVIVAFYDANGKMVAAEIADISEGTWLASATLHEKASNVKAFALGAFVPLGACDGAALVSSQEVEVRSQQELIAANSDPECDVITVASSFELTKDLVIDKDLKILSGVTLTVRSTVQCNGKVTKIGTGRIEDIGGIFAVEFGIETVDVIDDSWG